MELIGLKVKGICLNQNESDFLIGILENLDL